MGTCIEIPRDVLFARLIEAGFRSCIVAGEVVFGASVLVFKFIII